MTPARYSITLINLTEDARHAVGGGVRVERRVAGEELRALLQNFCAIDAVENASVEPEIRLQVKGQSWLVHAGQSRLLFYDALNRDVPGHMFTVDEAMAELDGSAGAARIMPAPAHSPPAAAVSTHAQPEAGRRRQVVRLFAAAMLAAALLATALVLPRLQPRDENLSGFTPLPAAEAQAVAASHAGVYLSGTQPGRHGIVLSADGTLRLFELRATDAPRLVHATGAWGRTGGRLGLATDQPGGIIIIRDSETIVYCNETYNRVP